jgi:hypothetical protein
MGFLKQTTDVRRGAVISECGKFRYRLWREWDSDLPTCCFICLNPSKADANVDDPTIRRCVSFARREGCGRLEVINLYAFRATDPNDLKNAGFPIGAKNDTWIDEICNNANKIVLAWGGISKQVMARADQISRDIWAGFPETQTWCLGKTKGGQPRHPLMLAANTPLVEYP